ncbi:DUF943 family protein [Serratia sp. UGAL515B_01]|uniref:DUF943 family protein n=1 Tax=Serratia sp. UGAL515B_01 TaxID=2986763 RepID=UPI0029543764|nr:DUF943 family protein [Serratia sp. UGAL515B_01]WON77167.1 DUF943 family protein [Serratia sp. UGAL515B_01]
MIKKNRIYISLFILTFALVYFLWLEYRHVDIIAVHEDYGYSHVLVENFPITDRGKINWWMKNKNMLLEKYDIPKPASNGFFSIIFWDFGDGYKEEGKYDRFCFNDMKTSKNCIDKNKFFSVRKTKNNIYFFTVNDGEYTLDKDGNVVKFNFK